MLIVSSSSRRVSPAPGGGGSPTGNWLERSSIASFRALAFNTEADRGPYDFRTGSVYGHAHYSSLTMSGELAGNSPFLDTSVTCEGNGSLRFDIPGANNGGPYNGHAAVGGVWYCNFDAGMNKANYCNHLANNVVFIQWRQRFNQAFIDTILLTHTGGTNTGMKHCDLVPGDIAIPYTQALAGTSGTMKVVMQDHGQRRLPIMYKYPGDEPMFDGAGGNIAWQNGMPAPYCYYPTGLNCFRYRANEWLTFQVMYDMGSVLTGDRWSNATIDMWGAYEGGTQQLINHYYPGMVGYVAPFGLSPEYNPVGDQIGKINFFPYITNKSQTQEHALIQTWYANPIIHNEFIMDPA